MSKDLIDLNENIMSFDAEAVERELIKWLRRIAKQNNTNQFKFALDCIEKLLLALNSTIEFLDEIGALEIYSMDCTEKYPTEFKNCFELYNALLKQVLDKAPYKF